MQFTSAFVALLLSATAIATALPNPNSPEPLMLDNGETTVNANAVHNALQARGGMCSGSARCSNSQTMKNDLWKAYGNISPTIYKNGGDKAGVCSGNVGIFVQGKNCQATGVELQDTVATLQAGGCQVCGHVTRSDGCTLKVDYVSSC